jgi:16S rRNA (cytosine1402-N4)-methyltransferase
MHWRRPAFLHRHASFGDMGAELPARGITQVDGVLLDLGVSSPQIDTPARGFSFRFDAPLDMRMDTTRGETAADFLARADERESAEVIRTMAKNGLLARLQRRLLLGREGGHPVRTTGELAALVARVVKTREPGQDPATRTFQGSSDSRQRRA